LYPCDLVVLILFFSVPSVSSVVHLLLPSTPREAS